MVSIAVPEKRPAALPSSVKLGLLPLAVNVGASLIACTVTIDAIETPVVSTPPLAVPPESTICVSATERLPRVGSCDVF